MLRRISRGVHSWSEIHGAGEEEYAWNSYLIEMRSLSGPVLIDPLPMAGEEFNQVKWIGRPSHILLTCEYHLRDTDRYRERWGCRLMVNERDEGRYEVPVDGTFEDRQVLWSRIEPIFLSGSFYPETAFLVKEAAGILVIGDLLSGGRNDQGIADGELGIAFPEHVPALAEARRSLASLLDLDFESIVFGHGAPIFGNGKEELSRYVGSEDVWNELERVRSQRGPKWVT